MWIRAQSAGGDPSVASVILRSSQADTVAQALELLGIDRMHGKAAVQESIHHRPVRHFNGRRDPAWLAREERRRGKLLPGYLADLVVLDRDPLAIDPEELPEIEVVATMLGGRWIHNTPPWD